MSNMLYILGTQLAQITGKSEISCRGFLRLAITDGVPQLQTADFNQSLKYMNAMTYEDWKAILESPTLASRLTSSGIKDAKTVLTQLKKTLVENQSLMVISAR